MAVSDAGLFSLNAGEISRLALARIDLAKLRVATEVQTNFLPRVNGPAMLRPGLAFDEHTEGDLAGKLLEFYFDETTKALLVLTPNVMRVMINGAYLTRPAVTATVTNGTFLTNLAGWTNSDEAGAASTWASAGAVRLTGTGTNYAQLDQKITVIEPNVEHAVRVTIGKGPIRVQIGTAQGGNTYTDATLLAEGRYSLTFTPTGDFWIRVGAQKAYFCTLNEVSIDPAGIFQLPTPWGAGDLSNIFYDQSGDVLFVAGGKTVRQYRIERRSTDSHSWGVGAYYADDGPFRNPNLSDITLTPTGGVSGHIQLAASRPLFNSGHVGALFRLRQQGQTATANLSGAGQVTGNIRVSGLSTTSASNPVNTRIFAIDVSGVFVGTITLQRSLGAPGSWTNIESYTTPTSKTYSDGLDNQIVFYRLNETAFTSGSATSTLTYAGSIQTGICRITDLVDNVTANIDVLQTFGSTTATSDWDEGSWSLYRGFPAAVALHDGRLFWQTAISINGSVSDAFASFDDTVVGDSGPIHRVIATGGQDGGRWMLSLQRLMVGTAAQEISIRSSAFDEPLTPTAFVARACSTRGAARVRALRVDSVGVFVERNAQRVFELAYELQQGDYRSIELTRLKQEMCAAGVVDMAVQRQPDTRLWFVLGDGSCAVLTYEKDDDVTAWVPVTTNGTIERVAVLPGTDEDEVYFIVHRGSSRFIEKLAKRSEAGIAAISKCMDCHVFAAGPTASVGYSHMPDGTQVVAWANGVPLPGPFTVAGGAVSLGASYANVTVGLAFTGQIKTAKLAYGAEHGTPLEMPKRVARVGLVMADVGWKGIRVGRDFTHMTGLPNTYKGRPLGASETLPAWDVEPSSFNGSWNSDSRVCIQVSSPYPATVMGLAIVMETNEPIQGDPPGKSG